MTFIKKLQKPVKYSVVFILKKDDKILIEKRKSTKERDPGKTTLPSGDIEKNENREQALARELSEEFDITPVSDSIIYLGEILYPKNNENVYRSYFLVTEWEGEITNKEAESLKWVSPSPENVDIQPDKIILKKLKDIPDLQI